VSWKDFTLLFFSVGIEHWQKNKCVKCAAGV